MQDRNGRGHRPKFLIRYRVGEGQYETRTYDITSASTSGRASKEEILASLRLASAYSCWYDPRIHKWRCWCGAIRRSRLCWSALASC